MREVFVYSTLSADNMYGPYDPGAADLPVRKGSVLIKGGANVVGAKHLITPRGMVTRITEEQLALCRADVTFAAHEANGFLTVESKQVDADHVAADMVGRDLSSPLVPQDLTNAEPAAVVNVPEVLAPVTPDPSRRR